ncbi:transcriptional regulator, ArsR family [Rhodopseudomonas palustris BisB5]|uniref:Transcriptional regulator, ArsR family n=1 Tax=Rhodopseudomonas palustris (strain BisB5) TaxID=316057 RepID=Q13E88_RHOPS|nr:transcriptional regulator, ArsR family [Rhodopseudomonas palustris BisB5]
MSLSPTFEADDFAANAARVATVLRALGNTRRLMILCRLIETGEMTVGALADSIGISQSALSQHLARLRDDGIVTYRRDSQSVWYRIAEPRIEQLIAELHRLFCRNAAALQR